MAISIKPATMRDVSYIAANLRDGDREEISCQVPEGLGSAVIAAYSLSGGQAWVAFYRGQPAMAFGVTYMTEYALSGWAYGTKNAERVIPAVTRFVWSTLARGWAMAGIRRIEARTLETHTSAHRWLEAAGAVKESPEPYEWGRDGERFYTYAWTRQSLKGDEARRWGYAG